MSALTATVAISALLAQPLPPQPPAVSTTLPRAGLVGAGINIDLFELGTLQAFAKGGGAGGVIIGTGVEIDLGPFAAVRLPLRIGATNQIGEPGAPERAEALIEIVFAPALIYRFRKQPRQRWVPYLGGGLELGFFEFGRSFLGLPLAPQGTAQTFVRAGVAPELVGGLLLSPTRWLSVRFGASYTYFLVAHTSAHAVTESATLRFSF